MRKPSEKETKIELRPDGWNRFKRAVDGALKTRPKRRKSAKPTAQPRYSKKQRGDAGD